MEFSTIIYQCIKKPINRYESILFKIERLKNRISGQVTSRKELKVNPNISAGIQGGLAKITTPLVNYSNKDEVAYPIATSKEVEDELVGILRDIAEMREKETSKSIPEFIFIIDELDKIGPHTDSSVQEKELTNPVLDNQFNAQESSQFRQRQEAVATLLANLKGFLNVIRAKFFFIGGREMFDADLADIADRDSFYSSVFNDVIYIESFFKDSKRSGSGVTQMTELYLCNIILNSLKPEENLEKKSNREKLDLSNLRRKIQAHNPKSKDISLIFKREEDRNLKNINIINDELRNRLILSDDENKRQIYKVMFLLQNYVIYLNYRSNGTPKKLTALTEQVIECGPKLDEDDTNYKFLKDNIVLLHDQDQDALTTDLSDRLFLYFDFNKQYEIGLTANLYRPYLIANSRHLKLLGDKLLFSSSFIIDHLLKFHPFGFSWKNLEHIPEIILVNREPNLRKYIEDLMRFYSLTYVRDTVSGIFDLKFRSVVKRELIYASKTSDLSSAAFNFTLDESFSIKRHYKKKLMELREKYKKYPHLDGDNQFVHSLYFVQTVQGDLYFYDKEYDEAILYYQEAIQTLRLPHKPDDKPITQHQLLLLLKAKLKLGLTFEKIRDFDAALSFYKTSIDDTAIYLKFSKEKTKNSSSVELDRTIHLITMPYIVLLAVIEKARYDGITYYNLIKNRKEVQDILAQVIEAEGANDEYRRYFQLADYYNNVGSILYYKNCQFSNFFEEENNTESILLEVFQETEETEDQVGPQILMQQRNLYNKKERDRQHDFFPSLTPFNYYWNALYFLLKYHEDKIKENVFIYYTDGEEPNLEKSYLALACSLVMPTNIDLINSNRFYYIANVVSKIGDCILSSLKKKNCKIPNDFFNPLDIITSNKKSDEPKKAYINVIKKLIAKFEKSSKESLFEIETVLHIYKLAAVLYMRGGQNYYYAFQLKKILYLTKDLIEINRWGDKEWVAAPDAINKKEQKLIKFMGIDKQDPNPFKHLESIAENIFKATTWNNEVANRPQILKYREILAINNRSTDREYIYNNISNTTDNREVVILIESIKLKLKLLYLNKENDTGWEEYLRKFGLSKSIISAYNSMNNRYLRILELKYRSERCHFITKELLGLNVLLKQCTFTNKENFVSPDLGDIGKRISKIITLKNQPQITIGGLFSFLIREALFCLRELIKMIKLYDPGYVIGYSYIAESHSRMGDWCHAYDNFKNTIEFYLYRGVERLPNLKTEEQLSQITNILEQELEGLLLANNGTYTKQATALKNLIDKPQKIKEILHMLEEFDTDITDLLGTHNLAYLESKSLRVCHTILLPINSNAHRRKGVS